MPHCGHVVNAALILRSPCRRLRCVSRESFAISHDLSAGPSRSASWLLRSAVGDPGLVRICTPTMVRHYKPKFVSVPALLGS